MSLPPASPRSCVRRTVAIGVVTAAVVTLVSATARDAISPAAAEVGTGSAPTSGMLHVGAGGYVTGMSVSDDGATRLVRTDTLGAYRWDADGPSVARAGAGAWSLVTGADQLPTRTVRPNLGQGVLAVAVAPSDGDVAYMAFDGGVFRSTDAARTWTKVGGDFSTEANDWFRIWGPRLVVDPVDPRVVYYGTQKSGLQVSTDGGDTWRTVPTTAVPAGLPSRMGSPGVTSVAVDRTSVRDGRAQHVYAASYGAGVLESRDAGATWSPAPVPGMSAAHVLRVQPDGDLVLTGQAEPVEPTTATSVWRRDHATGTWTDITPAPRTAWHSLATDLHDPDLLAVMASGGRLALSRDDGRTWTLPTRSQRDSGADVPWLAWSKEGNEGYVFAPGEMTFDPVQPGRLWLTEGVGVWHADVGTDLAGRDVVSGGSPSGTTVTWHSRSRGIEQLCPTDVVAPPGGAPVVSAWDRPLFRLDASGAYPETYGPSRAFSSAWSLDWSTTDPSYVVASVASHQGNGDPTQSGYSTDGGATWTRFPTIPLGSTDARNVFGYGTVAVSTPGNVVWVPSYGKQPFVTQDGGRTWSPIVLPEVVDPGAFNNRPHYIHRQQVAADRVVPGRFYLYVQGVGVFVSDDGGAHFRKASTNAPFATDTSWSLTLKAAPGLAGNLHLTPGHLTGTTTQPFFHSVDGGRSWGRVPGVTGVTAFGYGAPALPGGAPTIFVAGHHDGNYGVWRAEVTGDLADDARTDWQLVTRYPAGRTALVMTLDGDKQVPGRAYVSLNGGGWAWVGSDPTPGASSPTPTTPASPAPAAPATMPSPSPAGPSLPSGPAVPTVPAVPGVVGRPSATPTAKSTGTSARSRTVLSSRPDHRRLTGRLTTPSGAPVAGVPVRVLVERGGAWQRVGTTTTDRGGRVTSPRLPRGSVARLVFTGAGGWQGATSSVRRIG